MSHRAEPRCGRAGSSFGSALLCSGCRRRALRSKSSLVPRCGLSTSIAHADFADHFAGELDPTLLHHRRRSHDSSMTQPGLLSLVFIFTTIRSSAQGRVLAPERFDSIAFYADSTVRFIGMTRRGVLHGSSIEYDNVGTATAIGRYRRGMRSGAWIFRDGHWIEYRKGERRWGGYPGCRTGFLDARRRFDQRYGDLMSE